MLILSQAQDEKFWFCEIKWSDEGRKQERRGKVAGEIRKGNELETEGDVEWETEGDVQVWKNMDCLKSVWP